MMPLKVLLIICATAIIITAIIRYQPAGARKLLELVLPFLLGLVVGCSGGYLFEKENTNKYQAEANEHKEIAFINEKKLDIYKAENDIYKRYLFAVFAEISAAMIL